MLWVVSINEQKCKELGQIKKVRGLLTTIVHFLFARDKVDCCILVKNLLDADSLPEERKILAQSLQKTDYWFVVTVQMLLTLVVFSVNESHTFVPHQMYFAY
jgi:hypothetical protein